MLLVIPRQVDVIQPQRVMRGHDDADRAIDGRDLLNRRHVIDIAQLRATQLGGHKHAQQPHVTKLLDDSRGKLARLVPLHHVRCDLFRGKRAYFAAQLLLLLGQAKGVAGCVGEGGCAHR